MGLKKISFTWKKLAGEKYLNNEEVCLLISIFFKFTLSLLYLRSLDGIRLAAKAEEKKNIERKIYIFSIVKAHHENFPR
jgi:hypothetical protein